MRSPARNASAAITWAAARNAALAAVLAAVLAGGLAGPAPAFLELNGPVLVDAGGAPIQTEGYTTPDAADWNQDGLFDLIVGDGCGTIPGRVRVYLNAGAPGAPLFGDFFYAQSQGDTLTIEPHGWNGPAPRVTRWDGDGRKDLLMGLPDGRVAIYLNTATDEEPAFDGGTPLQVGPQGMKVDLDVGLGAVPCHLDWDADGRRDLVVGSADGSVHLYRNAGTDLAPDYLLDEPLQAGGQPLIVPYGSASPLVRDLDGDARKDLLLGAVLGELLVYYNLGTDAAPVFGAPVPVYADAEPLILPFFRSRPAFCDWDGDPALDLLVGGGDGQVVVLTGHTTAAPPVGGGGLYLQAPWPQPLRGRAVLSFTLPEPASVKLELFDVSGARAASIAEGTYGAGAHRLGWDGSGAGGRALPSGIYILCLEAGGHRAQQKLVLLR